MNDAPRTPTRLRAGSRCRRGASLALACLLAASVLVGVSAAADSPQFLVVTDAGGDLVPADRLSLTTGLQRPPPGRIAFPIDAAENCSASDNFGDRRGSSRRHEGLDITGSRGRAVYAVATGRLTTKYEEKFYSNGFPWSSGAGIGWKLDDEANDVIYKYFHLERHEPGLEVGDIVQFGDVIGYVGNTGTSGVANPSDPDRDTNYHLHFEYRPGNVPRDPRPLLVPHPNCRFS